MTELQMEMRAVELPQRLITGLVVPYDETSYFTPDVAGERICRGAFNRSIQHRGDKIALTAGHTPTRKMGTSRHFAETGEGLLGEFVVNPGPAGDNFLVECRDGYYGSLSATFKPIHQRRGADNAVEVTEAMLVAVAALAVPAYTGAAMLSVRQATPVAVEFPVRPDVNLAPIPPLVYRTRR